jgi:hypothetical protein
MDLDRNGVVEQLEEGCTNLTAALLCVGLGNLFMYFCGIYTLGNLG